MPNGGNLNIKQRIKNLVTFSHERFKGVVNGYTPIYKTEYGKVEGLPKKKEGIYYIVSMLVKQACPTRKDLFSPSQLVRNGKGQIIGCLGLE